MTPACTKPFHCFWLALATLLWAGPSRAQNAPEEAYPTLLEHSPFLSPDYIARQNQPAPRPTPPPVPPQGALANRITFNGVMEYPKGVFRITLTDRMAQPTAKTYLMKVGENNGTFRVLEYLQAQNAVRIQLGSQTELITLSSTPGGSAGGNPTASNRPAPPSRPGSIRANSNNPTSTASTPAQPRRVIRRSAPSPTPNTSSTTNSTTSTTVVNSGGSIRNSATTGNTENSGSTITAPPPIAVTVGNNQAGNNNNGAADDEAEEPQAPRVMPRRRFIRQSPTE